MLTTLSITSLDQGGEFARRHVATLYAEATDNRGSVSAKTKTIGKPKWRSLLTAFNARWATRYSLEAVRY